VEEEITLAMCGWLENSEFLYAGVNIETNKVSKTKLCH
jgi:hypothetical protein